MVGDDVVVAWGGDADDDTAWVGALVDVTVGTTAGDTTGCGDTVGSTVKDGRYIKHIYMTFLFHRFLYIVNIDITKNFIHFLYINPSLLFDT